MSLLPSHSLLIDSGREAIESGYVEEVRWPAGCRVNLDARLLLLALQRFRLRLDWTDDEFRASAVVLGCQLGAMESYEAFDRSLIEAWPAPLAFSHALPSIPLACASVYFGLHGQTLTLAGDDQVGLRALDQAVMLVRVGRVERAIAGCWEAPSETRHRWQDSDDRCRCLLVAIDGTSTDGRSSAVDYALPLHADSPVGPLAHELNVLRVNKRG